MVGLNCAVLVVFATVSGVSTPVLDLSGHSWLVRISLAPIPSIFLLEKPHRISIYSFNRYGYCVVLGQIERAAGVKRASRAADAQLRCLCITECTVYCL